MSSPDFNGKIAIVTGGSRGLGRAMALGFANAGAAGITITAAQSIDQAKEVAAEIEAIGGSGTALAVKADVTSWDDCQGVVEQTISRFGGVHILVNNAAKGQRFAADERVPFWDADTEGWKLVIDTNVNGPFYMAKAVVGHMIAGGWGRIINISKNRASMFRARETPYGTSKAALEAETLSWAQDLDGTGVTVNSLMPGGVVNTAFLMSGSSQRARTEPDKFLQPDVVVDAALWLASAQSDGITGCRYNGRLWDCTLPPGEAAEAAREAAIFLPPTKPDLLTRTWQPPGRYAEDD